MPDAETTTSFTVRAPWGDELWRLRKHLPGGEVFPTNSRVWSWVIAVGENERLVGNARLGEISPGQGRLELAVRAGWTTNPASAELIRHAMARARSLGWSSVVAQINADAPLSAHLLADGFVAVSHHEVWNLPVAEAIAARLPTIERTLARAPLEVAMMDETNLAAARTVCANLGLLEAERVCLQNAIGEGLNPQFSFVAGDAATPDGLAMARRLGPRLYLEVLARNPASPHPPRATVGALLKAVFLGARAAGISEIQCAVTPARAGPVIALMRRAGGQCINRQTLWLWRNR